MGPFQASLRVPEMGGSKNFFLFLTNREGRCLFITGADHRSKLAEKFPTLGLVRPTHHYMQASDVGWVIKADLYFFSNYLDFH